MTAKQYYLIVQMVRITSHVQSTNFTMTVKNNTDLIVQVDLHVKGLDNHTCKLCIQNNQNV